MENRNKHQKHPILRHLRCELLGHSDIPLVVGENPLSLVRIRRQAKRRSNVANKPSMDDEHILEREGRWSSKNAQLVQVIWLYHMPLICYAMPIRNGEYSVTLFTAKHQPLLFAHFCATAIQSQSSVKKDLATSSRGLGAHFCVNLLFTRDKKGWHTMSSMHCDMSNFYKHGIIYLSNAIRFVSVCVSVEPRCITQHLEYCNKCYTFKQFPFA